MKYILTNHSMRYKEKESKSKYERERERELFLQDYQNG